MSRATSGGESGAPQPFTPQLEDGKGKGDIAANQASSIRGTASEKGFDKIRNNRLLQRCWAIVSWTPPKCRWDPENPPKFSMALNLLFAFVSGVEIL
jgi:hypothetical protein